MVVNDVSEMICGQFVGALIKHLVVEYVALYLNVASNEVINMDFLTWFYLEAHYILASVFYQFIYSLF